MAGIELLGFLTARNNVQVLGWNPINKAKKSVSKIKKSYRKKKKQINKTMNRAKDSAKNIDWKKVHKTAQVVGPAIAIAYPPAAPFVAAGLAITYAASRGDPEALATQENIRLAKEMGVPGAEEANMALETAQAVMQNEKATAILTAAKNGDPAQLAKLQEIKELREAGDPIAQRATEVLKAARKGQDPKVQQAVLKQAAKNQSIYDSAW